MKTNMRRQDREVKDIEVIIDIIKKCRVMRLATAENNVPYIVPLNFGYTFEGGKLELCFHCAKEGKKLDIIKVNPNVAFEMDTEGGLIEGGDNACKYSYMYQSVVGEGVARLVADVEEKKKLLAVLMKHQTGRNFEIEESQAEKVAVCKIEAKSFSGKACVK